MAAFDNSASHKSAPKTYHGGIPTILVHLRNLLENPRVGHDDKAGHGAAFLTLATLPFDVLSASQDRRASYALTGTGCCVFSDERAMNARLSPHRPGLAIICDAMLCATSTLSIATRSVLRMAVDAGRNVHLVVLAGGAPDLDYRLALSQIPYVPPVPISGYPGYAYQALGSVIMVTKCGDYLLGHPDHDMLGLRVFPDVQFKHRGKAVPMDLPVDLPELGLVFNTSVPPPDGPSAGGGGGVFVSAISSSSLDLHMLAHLAPSPTWGMVSGEASSLSMTPNVVPVARASYSMFEPVSPLADCAWGDDAHRTRDQMGVDARLLEEGFLVTVPTPAPVTRVNEAFHVLHQYPISLWRGPPGAERALRRTLTIDDLNALGPDADALGAALAAYASTRGWAQGAINALWLETLSRIKSASEGERTFSPDLD